MSILSSLFTPAKKVCLIGALAVTGQFLAGASLDPVDWPHNRGPDGLSGVVEASWLKPWTEAKQQWTVEVGVGCTGVNVAGGLAYTAGSDGKAEDTIYCLNAATGEIVWKQSYKEDVGALLYKGGPNMTPVVHDGRVYHSSRSGRAHCLDAKTGEVIWKRQLQFEEATNPPRWGISSPPLILGDQMLINFGDAGISINLADGKTKWKSGGGGAGYATPIPHSTSAGLRVLVFGGRELTQVNPVDGSVDWRHAWKTDWDVNAANPIVTEHGIFISSAYKSGAALIDFGGSKRLWHDASIQLQMTPPVLFKGHIYGINANAGKPGELFCLSPADGKVLWKQKGFGGGSLIIAGDKILALSQDGQLVMAAADSAAYKELARAQILEKNCWMIPALANGMIYAKNDAGKVVCVAINN